MKLLALLEIMTDRPTDQSTNRPTDRPTGRPGQREVTSNNKRLNIQIDPSTDGVTVIGNCTYGNNNTEVTKFIHKKCHLNMMEKIPESDLIL